uniref:RNA helicase n=1 Tax=Amphilophus citrinellus TaxID=61819 RepID=A0A3Q0T222_AMPCI
VLEIQWMMHFKLNFLCSLQVENPSCLWGRVIRGPDGDAESPEHYSKLHLQMNLFYRDPTLDVHSLKPTPLEEGQVSHWICVCFPSGVRGVLGGDEVVVIRVAMENFLQLPFWVRRFHLAGIKPTTLRVSVFEEKAELRPSAQWDSSATLYLHSLLRASTHTEAVLLESESDSTAIELYLTAGDIKICVNDDLVVKKFAYYSTKSGGLEDWDRLPAMLSSSILTQTVSNKPTAQTQPPPGKQKSHCSQHTVFPHLAVCATWVSPTAPRTSGILVHSAFPVEPWSSLDDAPIADPLRWVLRQKQYRALTQADCYSWPAVARGCNTIIISNSADQPLSYLSPLLTHILLNSVFTSHTSSSGPIAVLLCPGWEKVQAVYDLLEARKVSQNLHPTTVLLGVGKDEAKSVKIPKNCLLLISTPFSLVRLLSCHCFLFLRLYHLVLDEADQLFTHAPDEMETILQHFQKVTSSEENASCPQQLVAVAKRWTSHMEGLLSSYMPYPSVVITVPEEAALYGNVQQIIVMTLESNKISGLLGTLALNSDVTQKTLIIVNSIQEAEDVFKAVSSRSVFCLKIHEGLTHEIDFVIQQWEKDIDPGAHVILVTTNDCLKCLGIRDATCVIHYSFPSSPKLFGIRLFCMVENFRNLSTRSCHRVTRSVLLISERNARHVNEVLRYLRRTNALLPPDLLTFAQGVRVAREGQKMDRPLCSYLKSFGVCRDNSICPERHRFISHLDQSELPASGAIEVVPLYIKTASVFYGRIIRKEDGSFEKMASEMASYYADKKPGPKELLEGGLYAVQEDDVFHRVKILSVPDRNNRLFISLLVRFIDVGKEEEVKSHQILQLPEQFHALPGQAVEIIVCRVKPVDSESSWHPKVTRAISKKIRGLQHRARAVLSLGNTVFVDPMVRVTQVPGMKTVINEYNVQTEILNTGMGMSNPEHLDLLRELCEEGSSCEDTNHVMKQQVFVGVCRPGDSWPSVKVRIKAEDGVLVNTFRVAEVKKLEAPDLPHLEPMSPPSGNQSLVPTPKVHLGPVCGQNSQSESEADFGQRNTVKKPAEQMESLNVFGCLSFHPLIRWCQTSDSVIITMKLMNPENQCCDFYADRVVYSGRVNGRSYRADLELHQKIAADVCSWEMKSNEPVLRLVKQQPGAWEKLLRNKSQGSSVWSSGRWFLENTGEEEKCYLDSKSSSESDN